MNRFRSGVIVVAIIAILVGGVMLYRAQTTPSPSMSSLAKRDFSLSDRPSVSLDGSKGFEGHVNASRALTERKDLDALLSAHQERIARFLNDESTVFGSEQGAVQVSREFVNRLASAGVAAGDQKALLRQFGKFLYDESLIRSGNDLSSKGFKAKLMRLAIAHLEQELKSN